MIDIEVHEIYALDGMKELLLRKAVTHLIIEVHPKILQERGKTDADIMPYLKIVATMWTNSIRKVNLHTIFTTIPNSQCPFMQFHIILTLVVPGLSTAFGYGLSSHQKLRYRKIARINNYSDYTAIDSAGCKQWTRLMSDLISNGGP
jgi:hypothetical protein